MSREAQFPESDPGYLNYFESYLSTVEELDVLESAIGFAASYPEVDLVPRVLEDGPDELRQLAEVIADRRGYYQDRHTSLYVSRLTAEVPVYPRHTSDTMYADSSWGKTFTIEGMGSRWFFENPGYTRRYPGGLLMTKADCHEVNNDLPPEVRLRRRMQIAEGLDSRIGFTIRGPHPQASTRP